MDVFLAAIPSLNALLIVAALALALILAWKFLKLVFKVALLAGVLLAVYFVGVAAGWWGSAF